MEAKLPFYILMSKVGQIQAKIVTIEGLYYNGGGYVCIYGNHDVKQCQNPCEDDKEASKGLLEDFLLR